jgi:23S rRNA (pseudouridine1915-N3)-methyltransferase
MIPKIKIIAIGKIKERYLQEGINEYLKRLAPFCKIEILELKDEGIEKEAKKIENYLNSNSYLMDANGKESSSEEFAEFLKKSDGELILVIGGSEGISQSLKNKCKKISLSKMTFLHEMSRFILLEQIYRAYMIINKRTYHK